MFNEVVASEVVRYLSLCLKAERNHIFNLYKDHKKLSFMEFTEGYLTIDDKIRKIINSSDPKRQQLLQVQEGFQSYYLDKMFFTDGEIDYLMGIIYKAICNCEIDNIPTSCDYRKFMVLICRKYYYDMYNFHSTKISNDYQIALMILNIWTNCSTRQMLPAYFVKNKRNTLMLYGYDNELCFAVRRSGKIEKGSCNYTDLIYALDERKELTVHTSGKVRKQVRRDYDKLTD